MYAEGKLSSLHEGEPFGRRLALMAAEDESVAAGLDIYNTRLPEGFNFLCNSKLVDIAGSLVGSEIICHPTQHLRAVLPTKLTKVDRTIGWHQDAGVLWPEADNHLVVTMWIPMVDAGLDNGCLEVVPGTHQRGLFPHLPGASIAPEAIPDTEPLPLPLKVGGMILFHSYMLHRGRPNLSDRMRWSMDLRYQDTFLPTGRPFYPSFIVRSEARPDRVQDSYEEWRDRWVFALENTSGVPINRWGPVGP
jgi:ectoine hydroxylase-related dioxygenase (phytanoyl-CoA dioxygenase family)